jgi:hypothetical protein
MVDDLALDHVLRQQADGPARVAGRRLGAGERDQLGLRGAVEDRRGARHLALLAGEHGIEPLLHQFGAHVHHHGDVGVERLADLLIGPALAGL